MSRASSPAFFEAKRLLHHAPDSAALGRSIWLGARLTSGFV
ncbi:MAG: hypothetical protein ABSF25_03590 [Bryobacteraceae bacterium]